MPVRWAPWPVKTTPSRPGWTAPETTPCAGVPAVSASRPASSAARSSPSTTARWSKTVREVRSEAPTSAVCRDSSAATAVRSRSTCAVSASLVRAETTQGVTTGSSPRTGRGAGAGAAVRTTWALVPPMPKEETPATRSSPGCGQSVSSRWTARPSSPRGIFGLAVSKLRLGGICPWSRASSVLSRPTMPAAPSRWPTLVLAEPTSSGAPQCRPAPTTAPRAAASMGSPTGVPVPCSSTYCAERGSMPAFW